MAMPQQCPTVAELVRVVKSLTRSDGTFQTAWERSFPDAYHCQEQGGYIYVDFPIPDRITRAYVVNAPAGATMNQRTLGPSASIDLNNPGIGHANVILVANFHTHPLAVQVQGDPQPSTADYRNAYFRGLPGIVISRAGIIGYGPERRINVGNPLAYATPIPPPGGIPPNHFQAPPPPVGTLPKVVAGKQWPEGTGDAAMAVGQSAEESGEEELENDVIYAEWSAEGVSHGAQPEGRGGLPRHKL